MESLNFAALPYCLHGLNAVYLEQYGWYRINARGNKPGVNAAFSPPIEALAFSIHEPMEQACLKSGQSPCRV